MTLPLGFSAYFHKLTVIVEERVVCLGEGFVGKIEVSSGRL